MADPATRPVHGDRRMSDVEALMWNLEKDPALASTFANVTILDQAPDPERLRRTMDRAVKLVPRLRQRVAPALGRLAPPEWQDDPNFDLGYHIRHIALPAPADERTLFDLAATLASAPLDRTRPLWDFTIIDGLDGGRAALFQKLHHTITDGEGGVRMSAEFIDFSRDGQARPEVVEVDDDDEPEPANLLNTVVQTVTHNVRRQLGVARRAVKNAADLARHPDKLPGVGSEVVGAAQSLIRQAAVTDHARSPLWTERSLRRRFEVLRIPLDDTKRAAKALGGSVNDLFVAGAKILANYPMGPTGGTAFNVTVLSSGGSLDMGVNIDTAAVDDPELLRRCLEDAYAELLSAG